MKFGKKEKTFILLVSVTVVALLYYLFILSPAIEKKDNLIRYVQKKEQNLKEIRGLRRNWEVFQTAKKEAETKLNHRGTNFTLLSYLESLSRRVGIDKKIQYMKPLSLGERNGGVKPDGIEIKLERMTVNELVKLLFQVEYSGNLLNIRRMKIQRSKKGDQIFISVTLQVQTYRL